MQSVKILIDRSTIRPNPNYARGPERIKTEQSITFVGHALGINIKNLSHPSDVFPIEALISPQITSITHAVDHQDLHYYPAKYLYDYKPTKFKCNSCHKELTPYDLKETDIDGDTINLCPHCYNVIDISHEHLSESECETILYPEIESARRSLKAFLKSQSEKTKEEAREFLEREFPDIPKKIRESLL